MHFNVNVKMHDLGDTINISLSLMLNVNLSMTVEYSLEYCSHSFRHFMEDESVLYAFTTQQSAFKIHINNE